MRITSRVNEDQGAEKWSPLVQSYCAFGLPQVLSIADAQSMPFMSVLARDKYKIVTHILCAIPILNQFAVSS